MANTIIEPDYHIEVFGVQYGIKYHHYRFASDDLFDEIWGEDIFEAIDSTIAYYFEPDVFDTHTAEELYEIYNKHS